MRLVRGLPASSSWDDLMYRIYVRQKIEAGLTDFRSDRRLIPMSRCSLELFCTRQNLRLQVQPGQLNLRKWS